MTGLNVSGSAVCRSRGMKYWSILSIHVKAPLHYARCIQVGAHSESCVTRASTAVLLVSSLGSALPEPHRARLLSSYTCCSDGKLSCRLVQLTGRRWYGVRRCYGRHYFVCKKHHSSSIITWPEVSAFTYSPDYGSCWVRMIRGITTGCDLVKPRQYTGVNTS